MVEMIDLSLCPEDNTWASVHKGHQGRSCLKWLAVSGIPSGGGRSSALPCS